MSDPTSGNWGSSGDNPMGASTVSTPKRRASGPGFNSYFQDLVNRAGGLQPRIGRTMGFKGGELDDMDYGQAEAHASDKYSNLPDDEAQKWEPTSNSQSSAPVAQLPHEAAQAAQAPQIASNIPAPVNPYGANADSDLARLRAAGKVGANQTISDPDQFKAAVADLNAKSNSYAAPAPTPAPAASPAQGPAAGASSVAATSSPTQPATSTPVPATTTTGRIGSITFDGPAPSPSIPPASTAPVPVAASTNPPPPVVGGTINGQDGNSVVAALKAGNAASDLAAGRAVTPTVGTPSPVALPPATQVTAAPVTAAPVLPSSPVSTSPAPQSTPVATVAPAVAAPAVSAPSPGIDEPGGLNDQLATSARDQGAAVNAKKASDAQFLAQRGGIPLGTPADPKDLASSPASSAPWPLKADGSWQPPPAPVPTSGGGMAPSDASGTANKYAGPTPVPAPSGGDIDPTTGKKRVDTASL